MGVVVMVGVVVVVGVVGVVCVEWCAWSGVITSTLNSQTHQLWVGCLVSVLMAYHQTTVGAAVLTFMTIARVFFGVFWSEGTLQSCVVQWEPLWYSAVSRWTRG